MLISSFDYKNINKKRAGFTVVEIIFTIVTIGILATISVVGYGSYQESSIKTKLKSELNNLTIAFENELNFNDKYPPSVPSSYTAGSGIVVSGGSSDGKTYCIDVTSEDRPNLKFFVDTFIGSNEIKEGDCSGSVYESYPVASSISGYWSSAPEGFLLEDGSAVSRSTYSDLFSVIGTTFGSGDGSTTFNLPDSRGRVAVNQSSADTQFDVIGEKYGTKTHVLTIAEFPSHTHGLIQSYAYLAGSVGATHGGLGAASYQTSSSGINTAHNNIQPSIVKVSAIKYSKPTFDNSALSEGTSISGYWDSAPSGYLLEDGSAVSRTTYKDLFNIIGTTNGAGDGSTTFNLPDSRGRVAVNKSSDVEFNVLGKKYGEKTHTLTTAEMPLHTHYMTQAYAYAAGGTPATIGFSGTVWSYYTGATGGDGAHNNIQPSIVKKFAIKYKKPTINNVSMDPGTSISGYWSSAPTGFLLEDGSAVSRTLYANLFAAIGVVYGAGDGSTTFNLPDSRGRVAVNKSSDTEFDIIGEKYGEKAHTLTLGEMPSHSHALTQYNAYGAGGTSAMNGSAGGASALTSAVGGSGSHNEIQPSIVQNFAIKY